MPSKVTPKAPKSTAKAQPSTPKKAAAHKTSIKKAKKKHSTSFTAMNPEAKPPGSSAFAWHSGRPEH